MHYFSLTKFIYSIGLIIHFVFIQTLILDEPTSGMDVESRRKVWDLLLVSVTLQKILCSCESTEQFFFF